MVRTATWGLVLALLPACAGSAGSAGSAGEGPAEPTTLNDVVIMSPQPGSTDWHHGAILFARWRTSPRGPAEITLTRVATGTLVEITATWAGSLLVVEPTASLQPDADYRLQVVWTEPDTEGLDLAFRTSRHGMTLPDDFELDGLIWQIPLLDGSGSSRLWTWSPFYSGDLTLSVRLERGADGDLSALVAAPNDVDGSCSAGLLLSENSDTLLWGDPALGLRVGELRFPITAWGDGPDSVFGWSWITARDLEVTVEVGPEDGSLAGAVVSAELDLSHAWGGDLFGPNEPLCGQVADGCEPCLDSGEPTCVILDRRWVMSERVDVLPPKLFNPPSTCEDILSDPGCADLWPGWDPDQDGYFELCPAFLEEQLAGG